MCWRCRSPCRLVIWEHNKHLAECWLEVARSIHGRVAGSRRQFERASHWMYFCRRWDTFYTRHLSHLNSISWLPLNSKNCRLETPRGGKFGVMMCDWENHSDKTKIKRHQHRYSWGQKSKICSSFLFTLVVWLCKFAILRVVIGTHFIGIDCEGDFLAGEDDFFPGVETLVSFLEGVFIVLTG